MVQLTVRNWWTQILFMCLYVLYPCVSTKQQDGLDRLTCMFNWPSPSLTSFCLPIIPDVYECDSNPCDYNPYTYCQDNIDSYSCLCRPGFVGNNCEKQVVPGERDAPFFWCANIIIFSFFQYIDQFKFQSMLRVQPYLKIDESVLSRDTCLKSFRISADQIWSIWEI